MDGGDLFKFGVALRPVEEEGFEFWGELFGLGFPVANDRGGSEDEGGKLAGTPAGDLGL
jgi:hypothetical protein